MFLAQFKSGEKNFCFFQECLVESRNDSHISLYASWWIHFKSKDFSIALIHFYIDREGFKIKKIIFPIQKLCPSDYRSECKNLLQYHNEALKIGYSLLFHPDKLVHPVQNN